MSRPGGLRLRTAVVAGTALAALLLPAMAAVTAASVQASPAAAPAAAPAQTASTTPPATTAPGSPTITVPSGPGTETPAGTTASNQPLSGRAKAGAVLGGLLLIGLLWAFSQGFGLLGGRPRRQIAAGPDRPA